MMVKGRLRVVQIIRCVAVTGDGGEAGEFA